MESDDREVMPLQAIAKAFRRSFETADLSNAPGFLPCFPIGCCHWASYVIGHFLKYEQMLEPFEVNGERSAPDGLDGHSWLTINDVIIDITSDEFPDCNQKVIVCRSSDWHNSWQVVNILPILEISSYDLLYTESPMRASDVYELLASNVRTIAST